MGRMRVNVMMSRRRQVIGSGTESAGRTFGICVDRAHWRPLHRAGGTFQALACPAKSSDRERTKAAL